MRIHSCLAISVGLAALQRDCLNYVQDLRSLRLRILSRDKLSGGLRSLRMTPVLGLEPNLSQRPIAPPSSSQL
jgi:hypothetical protein